MGSHKKLLAKSHVPNHSSAGAGVSPVLCILVCIPAGIHMIQLSS